MLRNCAYGFSNYQNEILSLRDYFFFKLLQKNKIDLIKNQRFVNNHVLRCCMPVFLCIDIFTEHFEK